MNRENSARQDALEQARRIHAEQIVMDSLAPTFTCEMMLTPEMVDMASRLQKEGKARSTIRTVLAEHLLEAAFKDAAHDQIRPAFDARSDRGLRNHHGQLCGARVLRCFPDSHRRGICLGAVGILACHCDPEPGLGHWSADFRRDRRESRAVHYQKLAGEFFRLFSRFASRKPQHEWTHSICVAVIPHQAGRSMEIGSLGLSPPHCDSNQC